MDNCIQGVLVFVVERLDVRADVGVFSLDILPSPRSGVQDLDGSAGGVEC